MRRFKLAIGFFLSIFAGTNISTASAQTDNVCKTALTTPLDEDGYLERAGLLTTFSKDDETVVVKLTPADLAREYIAASYVERGGSGLIGRYQAPKLIRFARKGAGIDIIRLDSSSYTAADDPLSRAYAQSSGEAVIGTLKVKGCDSTGAIFAEINEKALRTINAGRPVFRTERASRDNSGVTRATLVRYDAYDDNLNFTVDYLLKERRSLLSDESSNTSIRLRHIFLARSKTDFIPRQGDPRIGYFSHRRRDLARVDQAAVNTFIHRWRLEKKDPDQAVSEPKKPIKFWIENTTPLALRDPIREGVLAWNEAFEAAGFKNAIEIDVQPDDADWQAGEIAYNVIRWTAQPNAASYLGFAPAIHDPVTGEILGADIILDYTGFIDHLDDWRRVRPGVSATPAAEAAAAYNTAADEPPHPTVLTRTTLPPEIEVWKAGTSRAATSVSSLSSASLDSHEVSHINPLDVNGLREYATFVEIARGDDDPNINATASQSSATPERPYTDRLIREVLINIVMHEVGHALGLRHNFKGSRWRSLDEIHDPAKTQGQLTASVMDYAPINFAPHNIAQGDFANTRVGPYDIWAIEFGYGPHISNTPEAFATDDQPAATISARTSLLARAASPEEESALAFAESMDPHALQFDLTSTPVDYARQRFSFLTKTIDNLVDAPFERLVTDQSIDPVRAQFDLYNRLFIEFEYLRFILTAQIAPYAIDPGGAAKANDNGGAPTFLTPISIDDQRDAVATLGTMFFTENADEVLGRFNKRISRNYFIVDALASSSLNRKDAILRTLTDRYTLLLLDRTAASADHYRGQDLLFDVKEMVFGQDLSIMGRPNKSRQEQQILFLRYLTDLLKPPPPNRRGRTSALSAAEYSIVAASAHPVLNDIRRSLAIPYPWAPQDIRSHRQELRRILRSAAD